MEFMLDFNKLKQIIGAMPEGNSLLIGRTKGFMYLYEMVYKVLIGKDTEYVEFNVDTGSFDFDDLMAFEDYIEIKINPDKSPVLYLNRVIGNLKPINKPTAFI